MSEHGSPWLAGGAMPSWPTLEGDLEMDVVGGLLDDVDPEDGYP